MIVHASIYYRLKRRNRSMMQSSEPTERYTAEASGAMRPIRRFLICFLLLVAGGGGMYFSFFFSWGLSAQLNGASDFCCCLDFAPGGTTMATGQDVQTARACDCAVGEGRASLCVCRVT